MSTKHLSPGERAIFHIGTAIYRGLLSPASEGDWWQHHVVARWIERWVPDQIEEITSATGLLFGDDARRAGQLDLAARIMAEMEGDRAWFRSPPKKA